MKKAFVYGVAVEGENFTDRTAETRRMKRDFENGQNVVLISPRRMGKTSLVRRVISQVDTNKIAVVHLDIYDCRTEYEFYNKLATAVLKQVSGEGELVLRNIKEFLTRLTPKISFGIDPSNCTKEDIDKASEKLREQKPLLKKYVMDQVFTEMETSQSAIAPYYAGDIAAMMDENEDLDYCLPDYGSNLFYDAMCIPTCSKNKENAEKFINFMQKPEIAAENCKYLRYGCANDEAVKLLDDEIKNNELTLPSDEYLDKCYVFGNLDPEVYEYMQEQFVKIQAE